MSLVLVAALVVGVARAEPEARVPDAAEPTTAADIGILPPDVARVAVDVRDQPLPERIAAVSATLVGVPYISDPLGEGQSPDPDPLVRYDAFDCLTYVEEVLALSLAADPVHAADVRLGLRYGGAAPRYENRHHFMELQWIPAALANGWLRETTHEYGTTDSYHREVTDETWAAWRSRGRFALTDEQLPYGTMHLDYLPLEVALEAAPRIRPGSVVMTVREDRPWMPIWISHVGFVVPGERPTVRHATNMQSAMQVKDHGLEWYIEHLMTYENWKAVGIAVFEPVEVGPRRARNPR